jgi:hypothetical protein
MPPADNPYLELTRELNAGRLRAIIASGQAVVLHRVAIMSKDGDWIVREDAECLAHIRRVLDGRGARYRFGAPLDEKWLRGGWSSHFEHRQDSLRIRADFFTRPPRIGAGRLAQIWREQEGREQPFLDAPDLSRMKMTRREKDFVVIGELARRIDDPAEALLLSRSARDLQQLAAAHPALAQELARQRPLLDRLREGRESLEAAIDAERRSLMREDEERLRAYAAASQAWAERWPEVERKTAGLGLEQAHAVITAMAAGVLPYTVEEET